MLAERRVAAWLWLLAACGSSAAQTSPVELPRETPADVVTGASRTACGSGRTQCGTGWICAVVEDRERLTDPICARPAACEGSCESGDCVALLEPDRTACVARRVCPIAGDVYATRGCDSIPEGARDLPEPGCYEPCGGEGARCREGVCARAWIHPCRCEPGSACCDACGGEEWLCLR